VAFTVAIFTKHSISQWIFLDTAFTPVCKGFLCWISWKPNEQFSWWY